MNQLCGFQKRQAADLVFSTPTERMFDKIMANRYILVTFSTRTKVRFIQPGLSEQGQTRTYVCIIILSYFLKFIVDNYKKL